MKARYHIPHICVVLLEGNDVIVTSNTTLSGNLQNGGNYNADSEANKTDWGNLFGKSE